MITGKVYQQAKPLENANVDLVNTYLQTQSNNNGEFVIRNLKAGDYTLKISFLGLETQIKTLHLGADTSLNFTLLPATILSNEVIE